VTRLSTHFLLDELLFSETAIRMGRKVEPDKFVLLELERLCAMVLEPVRALFGKPIEITSGYRPLWLNQAIGGSRTSDHMYGRAVDFRIRDLSPFEVCRAISTQAMHLPIKQLILEHDSWTHLAICAAGEAPRREILTIRRVRGAVRTLQGIVPATEKTAA
jgi:zinc D-Ala-D-Ala carboxypeptidase